MREAWQVAHRNELLHKVEIVSNKLKSVETPNEHLSLVEELRLDPLWCTDERAKNPKARGWRVDLVRAEESIRPPRRRQREN